MATFFQKQQQVAALDPRLGGLMASAGLYNLRALIKGVRACKTLADERSLLQKESAAIRTAFKDDDAYLRYNNLSKLLYIHMLGYPAHFGQMECLKLVASPRFGDKRLGYLGIMLLLDENAQVLMLVTNGLKNDMNSSNMYTVGLALCTFANIASEEMSRDLCNEIERLMGSANSYIRKKVPDLIDHFRARTLQLLGDKSHGVQLCAVNLAMQICDVYPPAVDEFRQATSALVATLKNLLSTSFSPEHDVAGITDPFLQAKMLRFLRVLGRDSAAVSDAINDLLAQVATNTDASKNVGNSILYECVLTILEIRADAGLRVMAINILGKFLGNRDNNIRYVALNTLIKVVSLDTNAVQRHRATILECLRDADISIRRRALELTYTLINESNVQMLMRELLAFLEVADTEFKLGLTTQISIAAERFAPSHRWHIDSMLHALRLAGSHVRDEVLGAFIRLVSHVPELQAYTVQRVYAALCADLSQQAQSLAAVWVMGEFGDVLFEAGDVDVGGVRQSATPKDVVDLLTSLLDSVYANETVREYVLTALVKLHTRMSDAAQQARIATFLDSLRTSVDLETQKRAVEYGALLDRPALRVGVLETMPLPEVRPLALALADPKASAPSARAAGAAELLDLGAEPGETQASERASARAAPAAQTSTHDLLADIFGAASAGDATASAATRGAPASDMLDLLGAPAPASSTGAPPPDTSAPVSSPGADLAALSLHTPAAPEPGHMILDRAGVAVSLAVLSTTPDAVSIQARFTAHTAGVQQIVFQAAVPKSQRLQMFPISRADLSQGESATQEMRVSGAGSAPVRLRIRLAFTTEDGTAVREQVDWSS
ncbi:clathrin associated protein complex large subunit [Malassezia sp. CBS 17886]|nr:clathrin associated protein complex large subunit [Malassezia sp. CBS 17886]